MFAPMPGGDLALLAALTQWRNPPANLGFTSGRRTYAGNRAVGGVPDSDHLDGTAGDFTASPDALRSFFGPSVGILNEGDHRHVSGLSGVPYYGQQGTAGLVNGVDTTAPRGGAVPHKTLADLMPRPDLSAQAPVDLTSQPLQAMPQTLGSFVSQMPQGQVPDHKGLFPGKDWKTLASIALGALGDGLLMANGQSPIAAPMMRDRQQRMSEERQARERLQAQIEAQRLKAQEPPQFVQNLSAWLQMTPQQQHQYLMYQDASNPNTVAGPQGPQNLPRTQTKVINGKTYYSIGGEWYEEGE